MSYPFNFEITTIMGKFRKQLEKLKKMSNEIIPVELQRLVAGMIGTVKAQTNEIQRNTMEDPTIFMKQNMDLNEIFKVTDGVIPNVIGAPKQIQDTLNSQLLSDPTLQVSPPPDTLIPQFIPLPPPLTNPITNNVQQATQNITNRVDDGQLELELDKKVSHSDIYDMLFKVYDKLRTLENKVDSLSQKIDKKSQRKNKNAITN